jgi:phosphatidylcholine synthase
MKPSVIPAALVHVFTASGILCALLATLATIEGKPELAFIWLGVAFFIDGVDGTFARRYKVWEVIPRISGETMDLCIDYVTYVFVPALMLLQAKFLTGPFGLALAGLICMSSLYHFCDEGSKSKDNCFVGFPAVWNIVAFYIFAFQTPGWVTALIILTCVALTFVPMKYVHPMRVEAMFLPTIVATLAWFAAAAVAVAQGFPAATWVKAVLLVIAVYGIGLTLWFGRDQDRYTA